MKVHLCDPNQGLMVQAGKTAVKLETDATSKSKRSACSSGRPEGHSPGHRVNPHVSLPSSRTSARMIESSAQGARLVTLVLREREYAVKSGTTLLAALEKADILPESVIATREGEMILEDEILHDGDVIKLVAVISGG